nr:MAG TPA: RNA polymerase inhibitor [Caudoviricetes sp.]
MYKKKELKKYKIKWESTTSFEAIIEAESKEEAIQIIDEDFDSLESEAYSRDYVIEDSVYAGTDIEIEELDV